MSAWKSPLLFFGIVVIVASVVALVAPLFVDWSAYRADIEDYGRKLTGRDVAVTGPIEAKLFPWPVLILNGIEVANPEGANVKHLMEAERVRMSVALPPLIRGRIEVDAIEIDEPVFALERLPNGVGTWKVEPEQSLGALFDPDRIAVAGILIRDGTVHLGDDRRGGLAELKDVSATLAAPALNGPWRLQGLASYRGAPIDFNLGVGKVRSGEPVRFGLRVGSADGAGMIYSLEGEVSDSVKGSLKITPGVASSGKSDAEPGLRTLSLRSEVEADFDRVALKNIEISPDRATDAGNFITGEAAIELGSRVGVRTSLSAARLDLDAIIGAERSSALLSTDSLDALAAFLSGLPEGLDVDLDLAATSMVVGGETLEESRFKAVLAPERMRIEEISIAIPGQTDIRFTGLFVSGGGDPLLSGDVGFDAVSLRDFVIWALPERRRDVEAVWGGIRGRLKLDARLDMAPGHVRLTDARATLDDTEMTGGLSLKQGPQPGASLRLQVDRANLDRYAPRGWAGLIGEDGTVAGIAELLGEAMSLGDFNLTAEAQRLQVHGVEAEDVAVDVAANENGVELRNLRIGDVGAARLDLTGLLRFPGDDGVQGSLKGTVDAGDPRGLLRLLGIFGPEGAPEPSWARQLGPLEAKLLAEASTEAGITTASFTLAGKAGDADGRLKGEFRGETGKWREAEINVSGEARSTTGRLLASMAGLPAGTRTEAADSITATASGSLHRGLASSVNMDLFSAKAQFAGTIRDGRRGLEADGRLALLAERADELISALGLPTGELSPLANVLSAETGVAYDSTGLSLAGLAGTAGGAAFTGDLKLVFDPARRVSGRLATGRLSLPWLLQALAMPREPEPQELSSPFAAKFPDIEADIVFAAERLEALPGQTVRSAEVELDLDRWQLALTARAEGVGEEPVSGNVVVKLDSRGAEVEGGIEGKVALGDLLRAEDGNGVLEAEGFIELEFSGAGRTPAGLLSSARGEGSYDLANGVLKRVDLQAFTRDLPFAKQPSDIDQLILGSLRGGDMPFEGGRGTLKLASGVLSADPLALKADGTNGELRFVLELATGELDLSVTLAPDEPEGLPSFEIAYAGDPQALQPSSDTQELKSHLTLTLLEQSIDKLEELQREERRLIEEEEQFRREQQAREETEREMRRKLRELEAQRRLRQRDAEEGAGNRTESGTDSGLEGSSDQATGSITMPLDAPAPADEAPDRAPPRQSEPSVRQPVSGAADRPSAAAVPAQTQSIGAEIPRPRVKPAHEPPSQSEETSSAFKLPVSGNIGETLQRIFSGPSVLQPGPAQSRSPTNGRR